jgi:hypothetical protein
MNHFLKRKTALTLALAGLIGMAAHAQDLDLVGLTLLRTVATNVGGTGIRVAQVEATVTYGATNFEANPGTLGVSSNLFTYVSGLGTATNFPNSVGGESGHAHDVAGNFYAPPFGLATNVAHVDNYFADYFYFGIIGTGSATNIGDAVVNQSWVFGTLTVSDQQLVDGDYDDYAVRYKTLFVSGVGNGVTESGNGGFSCAPATCYNGIGVAAYFSTPEIPVNPTSSIGPTIDNGRAKPDITAPAHGTSFSTPQVAGAAADLMQAGLRGDAGSDTNSAADIRTVKALLLNGAVKPPGWTNSNSSPLDARYGAGILNIFNSYKQLTSGKQSYIISTTNAVGGAHLPTNIVGTVGVLSGWDYNTNSSGKSPPRFDAVNHYYFNVTNNLPGTRFIATATLVWNRQTNQSAINNLNLYLYNCANSNLVACSTSLVDNVEHIYKTNLTQGRYDLQVWKAGGSGIVSSNEPYALAFEFFSETLNIARSGTNTVLQWPIYPAGFVAEGTASLIAPVWTTNNLPAATVTNNLNRLILNATNGSQFFRLRRP